MRCVCGKGYVLSPTVSLGSPLFQGGFGSGVCRRHCGGCTSVTYYSLYSCSTRDVSKTDRRGKVYTMECAVVHVKPSRFARRLQASAVLARVERGRCLFPCHRIPR